MNNLSKVLKIKRIELGLTQKQMADSLGLSNTYLAMIEKKERTFKVELFNKLCKRFDFTPKEKRILFAECSKSDSKFIHARMWQELRLWIDSPKRSLFNKNELLEKMEKLESITAREFSKQKNILNKGE